MCLCVRAETSCKRNQRCFRMRAEGARGTVNPLFCCPSVRARAPPHSQPTPPQMNCCLAELLQVRPPSRRCYTRTPTHGPRCHHHPAFCEPRPLQPPRRLPRATPPARREPCSGAGAAGAGGERGARRRQCRDAGGCLARVPLPAPALQRWCQLRAGTESGGEGKGGGTGKGEMGREGGVTSDARLSRPQARTLACMHAHMRA